MEHLIEIPIIYVKYNDEDDKEKDCVQVFSKIQCYKRLDEQVKNEHLEWIIWSTTLGACRHIHCNFFLTIHFWKSFTNTNSVNRN